MTDPLDMRLDHALTSPFAPRLWSIDSNGARVTGWDVPNPYQRMRFVHPVLRNRQPKPKQLAGAMLGPVSRRNWRQSIALFARLDRSGYEYADALDTMVYSPARSVQQPTLFEVYAAASRGTFILTWQFAVRGKP